VTEAIEVQRPPLDLVVGKLVLADVLDAPPDRGLVLGL